MGFYDFGPAFFYPAPSFASYINSILCRNNYKAKIRARQMRDSKRKK